MSFHIAVGGGVHATSHPDGAGIGARADHHRPILAAIAVGIAELVILPAIPSLTASAPSSAFFVENVRIHHFSALRM